MNQINTDLIIKWNETLEYNKILTMLSEHCISDQAKQEVSTLQPYLNELEANNRLQETTQARKILDYLGNPPLSSMKDITQILSLSKSEGILMPEQLTQVMNFTLSCRRLQSYLKRADVLDLALTSFGHSIHPLEELYEELSRSIYNNRVDDSASTDLKNIRRRIEVANNQIKQKLESILRGKKEYFSDAYVSLRNGHYVLPVKKEYKHQVSGSVIDMSSSGSTYFIEPTIVSKLQEELSSLSIEEENEVRKILYILSSFVADCMNELLTNIEIMQTLDFIFAKAKLSAQMNATPIPLTTKRTICIKEGRHPLLNAKECVPLNFFMDEDTDGIVITGPNTGGKTVSLKTVGLFSMMAQSGLHIPCKEGSIISMNNLVLCDIGDGQSIAENLSTFSAHIKNIIHILNTASVESLVLLDELGSGTDPAEGMGIAISILEELRLIKCKFIATTHYPEVKEYVSNTKGLLNAKMTFDRESLKPLYRMEIGEAGESCALYIAKQLGFPTKMLNIAYQHAYKSSELFVNEPDLEVKKSNSTVTVPSIQHKPKEKQVNPKGTHSQSFQIGDSVTVYPQKMIGIIYMTANEKGELGVQIKGRKHLINHKRIKLKTSANELYPENYDFSIIFDSVEVRKARHQMSRKYVKDIELNLDKEEDL
jgi:dsDNA-specific endonuclease/ATPase MutS2